MIIIQLFIYYLPFIINLIIKEIIIDMPPYPAMLEITQQDPPNVPESKFSKDFRDFIRQCLIKDVKKRPRINELLKHPFLKKAKN